MEVIAQNTQVVTIHRGLIGGRRQEWRRQRGGTRHNRNNAMRRKHGKFWYTWVRDKGSKGYHIEDGRNPPLWFLTPIVA
jgi:hypothetical protein